jgi:hypothetical protein
MPPTEREATPAHNLPALARHVPWAVRGAKDCALKFHVISHMCPCLGRRHRVWSLGHKPVRTLRKASCISVAVEKRSALTGAHALTRNSARSALSSGRAFRGSITGS